MKLRIRGNSIRLRLKRAEVDRIGAGSTIEETTRFPNSALTCVLEVSDTDDISARFSGGRLVVSLPESQATDWATADTVSLHAIQHLPDADTLSVLIEKDFSCLAPGHHRDSEDDEDTFPHPSASPGSS